MGGASGLIKWVWLNSHYPCCYSEYGIYFTRYRSGAAGFPVCQILKRNHMIRDIEVIGRINKVMVFNSPGFTLDNARCMRACMRACVHACVCVRMCVCML